MSMPWLEKETQLMWNQSEVLAVVESEREVVGRSWQDDTAPILRPRGGGSGASTILLEEEDLEEVMELAGRAVEPRPWWSGAAASAAADPWHRSAVRGLRVMFQGLLFRLGWAPLGGELERATRPSPPAPPSRDSGISGARRGGPRYRSAACGR